MAATRKRGPQCKLGRPQLDRILAHMGEGHGRYTACRLEGVSYVTLRRRFKEDPTILDEIVTIERSRTEGCLRAAYKLLDHDNPEIRLKAANVYLSQSLKIREARRAVAAQRQSKVDNGAITDLLAKIADTIYDLVMPEKRDEMIRRLEDLERQVDAA